MKRSISLLLISCLFLSLFPYTGDKKVYGASTVTTNIAGGEMHTMAIKDDGTLWVWGTETNGRLGNGVASSQSSPVKIMDEVISVSSGDYSAAAIKKDGSLWTWGFNGWGQLCDGTTSDKNTPIKVLDNVASVSVGGGHILILKKDGTLWACGYNACGQIGDNTKENKSIPVKIMDNVIFIAAGLDYSTAITKDGSLWTWGKNEAGYLGNGTKENQVIPVKVLDNVKSVSTGQNRTMAIKNDGTLWGCGFNLGGTLGDGTKKNQFKFVKITSGVKDAALGLDHIAVLKNDNSLHMLGYNGWGQFGKGKKDQRVQKMIKVTDNVSEVTAERWHTAIIKTDGTLWASGCNEDYQLGNGTQENQLTFIKIMDGCNVLTSNNIQDQTTTNETQSNQKTDKKQSEITAGYYSVKNYNTPVYSENGSLYSYLYKDEVVYITTFKTIQGKKYGYLTRWQKDDYSISSLYGTVLVEMDQLEKVLTPVQGETFKERLSGIVSMLKSRNFRNSLFSEYDFAFNTANNKLRGKIVTDKAKKDAYEIVLKNMFAGEEYEFGGDVYRGSSFAKQAVDIVTILDPTFLTIGLQFGCELNEESQKTFAKEALDTKILMDIIANTEDKILEEVCANIINEKIDNAVLAAAGAVTKDKAIDIFEKITKDKALKAVLKKAAIGKTMGDFMNVVTGNKDVKTLSVEIKACNEIRNALSKSFYQYLSLTDEASLNNVILDWQYAKIATIEAYNRLPTIMGNSAYWKEYNKKGTLFQQNNDAVNITIREYGMRNLGVNNK